MNHLSSSISVVFNLKLSVRVSDSFYFWIMLILVKKISMFSPIINSDNTMFKMWLQF